MKKLLLVFTAILLVNSLRSQNLTLDWAKSIGGSSADYLVNIEQLSDGTLILAGVFQGSVDFDPSGATNLQSSAGQHDIYFARFDANGNLLYIKIIGGIGFDNLFSMKTDQNDFIYLSGQFSGTVDFDPSAGVFNLSPANGSIFFAKYDLNGNLIYVKQLSATSMVSISEIEVDNNGNLIMVGSYQGTIDFDPSPAVVSQTSTSSMESFVAKYNSNGDIVFGICLPEPGSAPSSAFKMCLDDFNNIYVAGTYNSSTDFDPGVSVVNIPCLGSGDIYFAKYDPNGNYLFAKGIRTDASPAFPRAMNIDNSENIHIAINAFGPTQIDADPSTTDYIITPASGNFSFIGKYDNSGNFLNAYCYETTTNSIVNISGMQFDNSNNLYVTGNFGIDADFDFSPGTQIYQSQSSTMDFFISKYDSNGNYIFTEPIGSSGQEAPDAFIVQPGYYIIAGHFSATSDFDPSPDSLLLSSNGSNDVFISKYLPGAIGLRSIDQLLTSVYPNPFSDALYLRNLQDNSTISLTDQLGKEVFSATAFGTDRINTSSLPPGCYIVEITSEGQTARSKMIKY